ncbi:MAG: hypothetical protein Q9161_001142 [Pseudevernia consocians]
MDWNLLLVHQTLTKNAQPPLKILSVPTAAGSKGGVSTPQALGVPAKMPALKESTNLTAVMNIVMEKRTGYALSARRKAATVNRAARKETMRRYARPKLAKGVTRTNNVQK